MTEQAHEDAVSEFRLVYKGEVLEGQHPAVVKRRLTAVLKLNEERMAMLFSGKSIVVKKATDAETAARYQAAFQKAGARLRVLPVGDDGKIAVQADSPADRAVANEELSVLPAGSDLLTPEERAARMVAEGRQERDIETSHIDLQETDKPTRAVFRVDGPKPEDEPEDDAGLVFPNVDHFTLAELGAQLGPEIIEPDGVDVIEIETDFDLVEVGATLEKLEELEAAIDVNSVDFEVSEPGSDLGQIKQSQPPPVPDTSHLKIDENDD